MKPTACTLADIGKLTGSDIPAAIVEAIDKYLGNFAKPIKFEIILQYTPPPAVRETVLITPAQEEEEEEQCPF